MRQIDSVLPCKVPFCSGDGELGFVHWRIPSLARRDRAARAARAATDSLGGGGCAGIGGPNEEACRDHVLA